ncbi:MAG: Gfo/Idh/MocA family oxidoreductase [Planctomycetes bacterium]|nr:Gfo/Idh/MocA family oxidoreductase [Planctomycetota bacterium]
MGLTCSPTAVILTPHAHRRPSPPPLPPREPIVPKPTRRQFLATSSTAVIGSQLSAAMVPNVHVGGRDEIKIALVGCGGRGTGAVAQLFNTKGMTRLVAVADAFRHKAIDAIESLKQEHPDKVEVRPDHVFGGLDAYKKAIDSDCDLVVIATPPGFKPPQFDYAVAANKHIFMEKPVAVDAPGVRRVLAAVERSKKQKLMVGIGLQRRHEPRYIETMRRIHEGAIGDVILSRVYWNGGGIWYRNREADMTEMAFQCNNWYHFNWLCGDQIVEQHIHNLDVGCWAKNAFPVRCNGMGGREMRMGGDRTKSQIFDHTFCEYTFADGSKMYSQGRHLNGGWNNVSEALHGTKGTADPNGRIDGDNPWRFEGDSPGGHQQEQHDLVEALLAGNIYNEGEYGAKSTFTAILGREACYSGKELKWDDLLARGRELAPGIDDYTLDTEPPVMPGEDGKYPVPVPGQYSPFA